MKAKTAGTYTLIISKTGHSSMLFLEWIATRGKGMVYSVRNHTETNSFSIRLSTVNVNEECITYINSNLYGT